MDHAANPEPHSSPQPSSQAADRDLDLAFEAAADLAPELLSAAGVWADPLAGAEPWHALFSGWLAELAAELPEPLQSAGYSLGLSLVGDAEIAALNADWRGKPGPTDVLAFAAQDADLDGADLAGGLLGPIGAWSGGADDPGDGGIGTTTGQAGVAADNAEMSPDDNAADNDEPDEDEPDDDNDDNDEDAEGPDDDEPEDDPGEEEDEDEDDDAEDPDDPMADAMLELGDIVISLDTAARQCEEHGQTLVEELKFLACHGLLHLLGWDHPDAESLEAMLQRQELLLRQP